MTSKEPDGELVELLGDQDIADDGFTARVMGAIPLRAPMPARTARWWPYTLPPVFAAAGCAAYWTMIRSSPAVAMTGAAGAVMLFAIIAVGAVALEGE